MIRIEREVPGASAMLALEAIAFATEGNEKVELGSAVGGPEVGIAGLEGADLGVSGNFLLSLDSE